MILDSSRSRGHVVSLTFDDGPDAEHTPRLLDVLREYEVTAAFFLWGDHVMQNPGIARAIAEAGHLIGNHSMHHDDMAAWSPERIRADLAETNAVIHDAVPGVSIDYFRAPYGSWGHSAQVAAEMGMLPLGWRLDVTDWEPATADELVDRLWSGITPESVILLHDGGGDRKPTVDAVERLIPELRERGWSFDLPAVGG